MMVNERLIYPVLLVPYTVYRILLKYKVYDTPPMISCCFVYSLSYPDNGILFISPRDPGACPIPSYFLVTYCQ
jgi:hypothetical protein